MIGLGFNGKIRRAYFEQQRPIKEIVRLLSVSRSTVRKVIRGHGTEFKYERVVYSLHRSLANGLMSLPGYCSERSRFTGANGDHPVAGLYAGMDLHKLAYGVADSDLTGGELALAGHHENQRAHTGPNECVGRNAESFALASSEYDLAE